MKRSFLLLTLAALAALSGCKNDDPPSPFSARMELLAGTPWIATAFTINPAVRLNNGQVTSDLLAASSPCANDDVLNFRLNPDRTFTLEEGATKCSSGDVSVMDAGTWSFNSDETALILASYDGGLRALSEVVIADTLSFVDGSVIHTAVYDVVEISAQRLEYTYFLTLGNQVHTVRRTFEPL